MGVIDPEAGEKAMDASTWLMGHLSAIGMRLWKMWREAENQVSTILDTHLSELALISSLARSPRDDDEGPVGHPGRDGLLTRVQR